MSVETAKVKLTSSIRDLRVRWDETTDQWKDSASQAFEKDFISPFELEVRSSIKAMETMAEFGAVEYCAVDTFATGIYRTWMGRQDLVAAMQLSTCLLGAVGLVYLLESWSRRSASPG